MKVLRVEESSTHRYTRINQPSVGHQYSFRDMPEYDKKLQKQLRARYSNSAKYGSTYQRVKKIYQKCLRSFTQMTGIDTSLHSNFNIIESQLTGHAMKNVTMRGDTESRRFYLNDAIGINIAHIKEHSASNEQIEQTIIHEFVHHFIEPRYLRLFEKKNERGDCSIEWYEIVAGINRLSNGGSKIGLIANEMQTDRIAHGIVSKGDFNLPSDSKFNTYDLIHLESLFEKLEAGLGKKLQIATIMSKKTGKALDLTFINQQLRRIFSNNHEYLRKAGAWFFEEPEKHTLKELQRTLLIPGLVQNDLRQINKSGIKIKLSEQQINQLPSYPLQGFMSNESSYDKNYARILIHTIRTLENYLGQEAMQFPKIEIQPWQFGAEYQQTVRKTLAMDINQFRSEFLVQLPKPNVETRKNPLGIS